MLIDKKWKWLSIGPLEDTLHTHKPEYLDMHWNIHKGDFKTVSGVFDNDSEGEEVELYKRAAPKDLPFLTVEWRKV